MYRCFALGIDFLLKLFEKRERQGSNYFETPLNWFVAQLAEYPAFNRSCAGSSPAGVSGFSIYDFRFSILIGRWGCEK